MKTFTIIFTAVVIALSISLYTACKRDEPVSRYKTQNVIIVVVDGARYSETWGLASRAFIPHRSAMLQEGVFCDRFYNNGVTVTNPGHTAMCTGVYQNINNSGMEYPAYPSIFQCWLKEFNRPQNEAWVITTKDKLDVLSNCTNSEWKDTYRPMRDCGIAGLGTGYREDSTTYAHVTNTLNANNVKLMIVNFKQPDASGHANDSAAYLQGIIDTDNYISKFWQQIQSSKYYKDRTTLIVTNDHGLHTAGHLDGFVSHGDECDGCRHIEFFAAGPDFKQNYICSTPYEQIDIASTVAELLNFKMPFSNGKVMRDIFKN